MKDMTLTPHQETWCKQVADADGDVLIYAGAGAGKSTALAWSALAATMAGAQVLCNARTLAVVIDAFPQLRFNMGNRQITLPGSPGRCYALRGSIAPLVRNLKLDVAFLDDIDQMDSDVVRAVRKRSTQVIATATPGILLQQFPTVLGGPDAGS